MAQDAAENRVLDALLPLPPQTGFEGEPAEPQPESHTRKKFREMLRRGELDDKEINIELSQASPTSMQVMGPPGMEEFSSQLQDMFANLSKGRTKPHKIKVAAAMKLLLDEETTKLINEEELREQAVHAVEQHGIVFLDEIDKISADSNRHGGDVSRQGVQRDLLPLAHRESYPRRGTSCRHRLERNKGRCCFARLSGTCGRAPTGRATDHASTCWPPSTSR